MFYSQAHSIRYLLLEGTLSLCLTNKALCNEDVWGGECIDPRILDIDTRWR
jgi:hypothetical protein